MVASPFVKLAFDVIKERPDNAKSSVFRIRSHADEQVRRRYVRVKTGVLIVVLSQHCMRSAVDLSGIERVPQYKCIQCGGCRITGDDVTKYSPS